MSEEKIIAAKREKDVLRRLTTESGFSPKVKYTPEDIAGLDYAKDIADPGQYPFTRGMHPTMYRKMLWASEIATLREIPEKTTQEFARDIDLGLGAYPLSSDECLKTGIDPDHPLAKYDVGLTGVPYYCLNSLDRTLKGVSLEDGIFIEHGAESTWEDAFLFSSLMALAEKRGVNKSNIRGSNVNDPLLNHTCKLVNTDNWPFEIPLRLHDDIIEYAIQYLPQWRPWTVCGYDWGDIGLDAVWQVAINIGASMSYIDHVMQDRGLKFEQLGNRFGFSLPMHMDIFENVAKQRALRRLWAKIAKERYHIQDPNLAKVTIWSFPRGTMMTAQHVHANIARLTIACLSAVLGGSNAILMNSYDEAVRVPSLESQLVSAYVERMMAHETNIALTADPLGGSYYVEWLTNQMEEGAREILNQMDAHGGAIEAYKDGWLGAEVDKQTQQRYRDIEEGKTTIIGVNAYQFPETEATDIPLYQYGMHGEGIEKVQADIRAELKQLKESRDTARTREMLLKLRSKAETKGENLIYPMIDAWKADATKAEVFGMIREGMGCTYDGFDMVARPSFLD